MNFCLNTYLANPEFRDPWVSYRSIAIYCKDGFKVSAQASKYHYCCPRTKVGPWDEVELGFPSTEPGTEILGYAENPEDPTGTVYAYVPVCLVEQLINSHGGPDYEKILAHKQERLSER